MNKHKLIKRYLVLMLLLVSFSVKAQTANLIIGQWQDADHPEKQLEIVNQSGRYFGKSIKNVKAANNGSLVFKDLVWQESSKSYKGLLISPENGEEFKIEIKMIDRNRFKFSVGKFIFTKTFTFKRIV